jgi:hypothetical protein
MDFPPSQTPQFGSCDILIEFNSNINFWFQYPNITAIASNQFDFLTIALHEYLPLRYRRLIRLMHGLGFMSAWADYLQPNNPQALTPQIALGNPNSQNVVQFEGFVEYAYDRLMTLTNYPNVYATNISAQMVQKFGNLGQTFKDTSSLKQAFLSSPAYRLGVYMNDNATQSGLIQQALPIDVVSSATYKTNMTLGPPITLETSFNNFISGSSLNHVDGVKYLSTADFLMRYSTPKGKTLQDFIEDYGTNGDISYGPFGPGLRYILAGIGYRVRGGVPLGGSTTNGANSSGAQGNNDEDSEDSGGSAGVRVIYSWGMWITMYVWILGSWVYLG